MKRFIMLSGLMFSVLWWSWSCSSGEETEEAPPVEEAANATEGDNAGLNNTGNAGGDDAANTNDAALAEPVTGENAATAPVAGGTGGLDTAPVFFDFDAYVLNDTAKQTLATKVDYLKANAAIKITVEGHCDERGSNQYNLALGERRAHAVKMFLVNAGASANNVSVISYGEEKPADPGHDEAAWTKNRRTEFVQQ